MPYSRSKPGESLYLFTGSTDKNIGNYKGKRKSLQHITRPQGKNGSNVGVVEIGHMQNAQLCILHV